MDARFALARQLNSRGMIAGSMIMDYHKVAGEMTPEEYVRQVIAGTRVDTNLSKQLHKGFRALHLIPEYENDPRSLNWAVAIRWDNPDYQPDYQLHTRIIPFIRPAQGERPAAR